MKRLFIRFDFYMVGFAVLITFSAGAQTFPETLWVPVTFYDFHADGSNPEFQPNPHNGGLYTGMTAETLSPDRKPLPGQNPFFSTYLHKWYRPWAPGDFSKPVYAGDGSGRLIRYDRGLDHDTAFKNIVIHDSLPFTYDEETGMYGYENDEFFMLDGRGFGTEPDGAAHNYSFTMELHTTFVYEPGQTFEFKGDDDVWAFVDNRLALDLGGIHTNLEGQFAVDDIDGLVPGRQYAFDFFYAERHTVHSQIKITTNIIGPPSRLRLYGKPGAPGSDNPPLSNAIELTAGDQIPLHAHVLDSEYVWRPEFDDMVAWEISDPTGRATLGADSGSSNVLSTTGARGQVVVTARFEHPDFPGSMTTVTLSVNVLPRQEAGPNLVRAITRDTDGNGYLDAIEMYFDSLVTIPGGFDPAGVTVSGGGKTFVVNELAPRNGAGADSAFIVRFTEQADGAFQTGWQLHVSGAIAGEVSWSGSTEDGAGPVIDKAVHYPGVGEAGDTLRLKLSESAACIELTSRRPSQSFNYYRNDAEQSGAALGQAQFVACGAERQQEYVLTFPAGGFQPNPDIDSIQLVKNAIDAAGNEPHPDGRRAPIFPAGAISVQAAVSPSPFLPGAPIGEQVESSQTLRFYRNIVDDRSKGVIVGVSTSVQLHRQTDGCYGKADIYDAVGNLVRAKLPVQLANNDPGNLRDYGILWDGANEQGRRVGGGAYLMVIRGTDIQDRTYVHRIKIPARIR
jgi:fibro-slime domain-containing protein